MTAKEQRAADEAIVLAALPGNSWTVAMRIRANAWQDYVVTRRALRRLKRKGLARYVRETGMWERV